MEIYELMKLEATTLTHEARVLRKWELKAKNKAMKARAKGKNFSRWDETQARCMSERMCLKHDARLLHVARAYLKGHPYKVVEQGVREGNELNIEHLSWELASWGYDRNQEELKEWMEA